MALASSGGSASPRKPWEVARSAASGPSPFRPASEVNSTAAVVESAGVADSAEKNVLTNPMASVSRPPMPIRSYGGAGYPMTNHNQYNNGYTTNSSYGGTYGGYNRGYGMGGGTTYGGGYGLGNSYGGSYGGGGMYGSNYGGGMYGGGGAYGMGMGGMGMGMGLGMGMGMGNGGPGSFQNGSADPNNPFGDNNSAGPPSFWQSTLQKMHWMVVVFGNVASLVSENTQTFHIITTALFQFCERSGMLAGFVLKLLRMWSRPKLQPKASMMALPGPKSPANLSIEGPKGVGGAWDNVWSGDLAG
eukprot:c21291_g1_i1 orf=309-1214(+)